MFGWKIKFILFLETYIITLTWKNSLSYSYTVLTPPKCHLLSHLVAMTPAFSFPFNCSTQFQKPFRYLKYKSFMWSNSCSWVQEISTPAKYCIEVLYLLFHLIFIIDYEVHSMKLVLQMKELKWRMKVLFCFVLHFMPYSDAVSGVTVEFLLHSFGALWHADCFK